MVVTRLWEVTSKGKEALASSSSGSPTSPSRPPTIARGDSSIGGGAEEDVSSYWNSAMNSMRTAATSVSSKVSSLFGTGDGGNSNLSQAEDEETLFYSSYNPFSMWAEGAAAAPIITSRLKPIDEYDDDDQDPGLHLHQTPSRVSRRSMSSSPWSKTPHADLLWMFRHDKNPYSAVRGRDTQPSAMTAARSLVALVPTTNNENNERSVLRRASSHGLSAHLGDETEVEYSPDTSWSINNKRDLGAEPETFHASPPPPPADEIRREKSDYSTATRRSSSRSINGRRHKAVSASETASQLAEGTIRALRDLALDEAVELQTALRFWNDRWERPLLSWLEAGPLVWFSPRGYNHQDIGRKVSQIQAVLARRCAAVGELQQHLLRAGWHRGVAQWGVLGQGGQWAPVAGFDGSMPEGDTAGADDEDMEETPSPQSRQQEPFSPELSVHKTPPPPPASAMRQTSDSSEAGGVEISANQKLKQDVDRLLMSSSRVGVNESSYRGGQTSRLHSQAQVLVGKKHGEGIFVDDPNFLAEWSIEAIALVRRNLFRAGNGKIPIPFETNWINDSSIHSSDPTSLRRNKIQARKLPLWATEQPQTMHDATQESETVLNAPKPFRPRARVTISDVPLLVAEVEELLDIMEGMMSVQRHRRLERLRPPSWLRSNWYMVASVVPSLAFLARRLGTKGYGREAITFIVQKVTTFFRERVVDPVAAIFNEVWRGRESFSDPKVRMEASESLKKMIRSWLDDTFPDMPESKRIALSEAMDVTLVEKMKEQSMRTFFEINNVIRMSFIEMQYMKKEMMAALHAMDEVMSANDINMNLAAITPAVLVVWGSTRLLRFLLYFVLKLGKSREETYASFRHVMQDIERLVTMRDNPPLPPPFPDGGNQIAAISNKPCVLGSDDLGMLMLLIHECRSILWKDRRRFSQAIVRSVSEDLAELAGERGAVSVQQQLRIIERMCRSYPFLKVVSTGHQFQFKHSIQ